MAELKPVMTTTEKITDVIDREINNLPDGHDSALTGSILLKIRKELTGR